MSVRIVALLGALLFAGHASASMLAAEPIGDGVAVTATTAPETDAHNNGWSFVADANMLVTGLSAYDFGGDGFAGDVLVTLWSDAANASDALLAWATIPAVGTPGSLFPTKTLATPVALSAGSRYIVAAGSYENNGDPTEQWDRWLLSSVQFNAPVSDVSQVYNIDSGVNTLLLGILDEREMIVATRPGVVPAGAAMHLSMGGNFTFILVPEPGTLALVAGGLVLARIRRSNRR